MQERQKQYKNSPYLNAFKTKDCSFLPKISKFDHSERRQFASKSNQKHQEQSIFKAKNDQLEIMRPVQLDIDRITSSKEYKAMQKQIEELQRQHQQEGLDLEQRISKIQKILATQHKSTYDHKYSMWELRNQILSLQSQLADQQAEYESLMSTRGMHPYPFNQEELGPHQQQQQQEQQQQGEQQQGGYRLFGHEQEHEEGEHIGHRMQMMRPNDGKDIEQLQSDHQYEQSSKFSQIGRLQDDDFTSDQQELRPMKQLSRFN